MAIDINDLDNNLQPVGASLLSGNESIMDNLRELSDEELQASGGGKGSFFISNGGFGGTTFFSGGKKGGFFISQPQPSVATQPILTQSTTSVSPASFGGGFNGGFSGGFGNSFVANF